ncbi:MAG: 3-deoxy-manno-octulosonate cytidylyltransferase [Elusimicrobia bacterium]|nr:3-deoxy-manno-octulosonate cytidylyltransferase [Elusimicrobiota bacterium]
MTGGCLVVIPARLGSTRFPGKVLAKLRGRSIVEWCWRAAKAAKIGPVLVATEEKAVADAVRAFGGVACLTSKSCASGTDRVYKASRMFPHKVSYVLNLQGDQPLVDPRTLRAVVKILESQPKADVATAVIPLDSRARAEDPNVVKAALAKDGRALYFSRSPIPFPRNGTAPRRWEHLGIYGFRRAALERFVKLPPSRLEKTESLEQLRALEDGMSIYAAVVSDLPVAIDTPSDLHRAERMLKKLRGRK